MSFGSHTCWAIVSLGPSRLLRQTDSSSGQKPTSGQRFTFTDLRHLACSQIRIPPHKTAVPIAIAVLYRLGFASTFSDSTTAPKPTSHASKSKTSTAAMLITPPAAKAAEISATTSARTALAMTARKKVILLLADAGLSSDMNERNPLWNYTSTVA